MSIWKSCPDLMARLTKAQNHEACINQDVMTFAGFCDDRAELLGHVEACEARVADHAINAILAAASKSLRAKSRKAATARAAYAIGAHV